MSSLYNWTGAQLQIRGRLTSINTTVFLSCFPFKSLMTTSPIFSPLLTFSVGGENWTFHNMSDYSCRTITCSAYLHGCLFPQIFLFKLSLSFFPRFYLILFVNHFDLGLQTSNLSYLASFSSSQFHLTATSRLGFRSFFSTLLSTPFLSVVILLSLSPLSSFSSPSYLLHCILSSA